MESHLKIARFVVGLVSFAAPLLSFANGLGENVVRNGDFEDDRTQVGNDYRYSNEAEFVCPEWETATWFGVSKPSTWCVPNVAGIGKYTGLLRNNDCTMQQNVELTATGTYTLTLSACKGKQYNASSGVMVVELVRRDSVLEVTNQILRVRATDIGGGYMTDFSNDVVTAVSGTYTLRFRQENPDSTTVCETCVDNVSLRLTKLGQGTLFVDSESARFGRGGLPAYGMTGNHFEGEEIVLTAPQGPVVDSPTLKVVCAGWKLIDVETGAQIRKGKGTVCAFSFPGHSVRVSWLWNRILPSKPGRMCEINPVGYVGSATLSGFPLLVRISPNLIAGFDYADVTSPQDLAFVDVEGHQLAYEVDTWNPSGESCVWVRLHTLSPERDNRIMMAWKNAKPVANLPSDVWAEYASVWHFGTGLSDSTTNAIQLTMAEGVSGAFAAGMVGGALNTTPPDSSTNYAPVRTADDYLTISGTDHNSFAVSGWFYWPEHTPTTPYAAPVSMGEWNKPGWYLEYQKSSDSVYLLGDFYRSFVTGTNRPEDGWIQYVFTYDGTGVKVYFNGVERYSQSGKIGENTKPLEVSNFKGWVDETRVRKVIPSADWIAADYEQVTTPGFVTVSAAETVKYPRGTIITFQ